MVASTLLNIQAHHRPHWKRDTHSILLASLVLIMYFQLYSVVQVLGMLASRSPPRTISPISPRSHEQLTGRLGLLARQKARSVAFTERVRSMKSKFLAGITTLETIFTPSSTQPLALQRPSVLSIQRLHYPLEIITDRHLQFEIKCLSFRHLARSPTLFNS